MGYARKDIEKTKKIAKKSEETCGRTKKQGLTFCHTKIVMWMWRNKNRYGENRKTKVGKCKKESIEYPGGRFYV